MDAILTKSYKIAGVYCIQQRGRGNGVKRLIGTSTDIERTFQQSKTALQRGNFHNYKLQADYNHNPNFEFFVMFAEPYEKHYTRALGPIAQAYIERYQTMDDAHGYNGKPLSPRKDYAYFLLRAERKEAIGP